MLEPVELLHALAGTRFGPVEFDDAVDGDVLRASCRGVEVEVIVDGTTVRATAPIPSSATALLIPAGLLAEVLAASTDAPARLACWATSCLAGEVASAVSAVATLLHTGGASPSRATGQDAAWVEVQPDAVIDRADVRGGEPVEAADGLADVGDAAISLPSDVEHVIDLIGAACSRQLGDAVRELLLGQREQITLGRMQLDELTGAVIGDVTVFGVGAGGRGGATVHALIEGGRVADVEVRVDDEGVHVEPASEGAEITVALERVAQTLATAGRRLARISASDDAVIVATEPVA